MPRDSHSSPASHTQLTRSSSETGSRTPETVLFPVSVLTSQAMLDEIATAIWAREMEEKGFLSSMKHKQSIRRAVEEVAVEIKNYLEET